AEHLLGNLQGRVVRVPQFALLDKPRVLSETAGIDEEWDAVPVAELAGGTDVGHAHRLAATGIIGDRDHTQRDVLGADLRDRGLQALQVDVALEGVVNSRLSPFCNNEVPGFGPGSFDV